ncbi:hypothetical protein RFI_28868 [Reticulomyxa filosa]|uniref:RanBP2-type domain-containing protein n=1 Tax=Reticulomyxa filosa TaxID=46433 RepID=X6M4G0_RETFI|nr:hypothetical protein RFI_28868 [Reticulomyxa filosa]|eukprot:ETO08521.1 hypothetical protein RFI_28868 [Reticulomyxa filosa]
MCLKKKYRLCCWSPQIFEMVCYCHIQCLEINSFNWSNLQSFNYIDDQQRNVYRDYFQHLKRLILHFSLDPASSSTGSSSSTSSSSSPRPTASKPLENGVITEGLVNMMKIFSNLEIAVLTLDVDPTQEPANLNDNGNGRGIEQLYNGRRRPRFRNTVLPRHGHYHNSSAKQEHGIWYNDQDLYEINVRTDFETFIFDRLFRLELPSIIWDTVPLNEIRHQLTKLKASSTSGGSDIYLVLVRKEVDEAALLDIIEQSPVTATTSESTFNSQTLIQSPYGSYLTTYNPDTSTSVTDTSSYSWSCPACTLLNAGSVVLCTVCETPKPQPTQLKPPKPSTNKKQQSSANGVQSLAQILQQRLQNANSVSSATDNTNESMGALNNTNTDNSQVQSGTVFPSEFMNELVKGVVNHLGSQSVGTDNVQSSTEQKNESEHTNIVVDSQDSKADTAVDQSNNTVISCSFFSFLRGYDLLFGDDLDIFFNESGHEQNNQSAVNQTDTHSGQQWSCECTHINNSNVSVCAKCGKSKIEEK